MPTNLEGELYQELVNPEAKLLEVSKILFERYLKDIDPIESIVEGKIPLGRLTYFFVDKSKTAITRIC
jgi:hypothetical protein